MPTWLILRSRVLILFRTLLLSSYHYTTRFQANATEETLIDYAKLAMGNNKVLLHSTRNCTQYPLIKHDGKEYEKECTYV